MVERDFEKSLTTLAECLRAQARHQQEILTELEDHLAQRRDELIEQGLDHHEAVRRAVAELGDLAELAARFLVIRQLQKRRWMMRCCYGSVTVVILVALFAMAFWPDTRLAPMAPRAVAQDALSASGEPSIEENNALTEGKLSQRIGADFLETPLTTATEYISEQLDVQFYLKWDALSEAGIDENTPVTIRLERVRGDMLLDLVLDQVGLTYVIRDGIVIVSSNEDLEIATEVRVYNCRDLLNPTTASNRRGREGVHSKAQRDRAAEQTPIPQDESSPDATELDDVEIQPSAADDQGSTGRIPSHVLAQFGGSGSPYGAAGGAPSQGGDPYGGGGAGGMGGRAGAGAMSGGAGAMGGGAGAMGGGAGGMGGRAGAVGGRAGAMGGRAGAMGSPMGGGGPMPGSPYGAGYPGMQGPIDPRITELLHIITTTVEPDSWRNLGGYGTIAAYDGLVVINHNLRVHRQVEQLLQMLREAARVEK